MLFTRDVLDGVVAGTITLAFRRWRRPTVRTGGRLRTAVGVLAIEAVDMVREGDVSEREARRAGFPSRAALLAALARGRQERALYRVRLHYAGPDPRVALRQRIVRTTDELADVRTRLARLDAASRHGAWTERVLSLIAERPGVRAAEMAAALGRELLAFKTDVRKLKELGLTESLEVGYRLSPRGRAVLARLR